MSKALVGCTGLSIQLSICRHTGNYTPDLLRQFNVVYRHSFMYQVVHIIYNVRFTTVI